MELTRLTVLVLWWPPAPLRQFSLSFRRCPSPSKSCQLGKCSGGPSKAWTCVLSFQVLNILSSDSYSLFEAALFCPLPATIPILMAVCAVYAFFILGPTALIGISVYLLFIPIQVIASLCSCISCTLSLKWVKGFASRAWPWNLSPYFGLMDSIVFKELEFKELEFECPGEGVMLLQFVKVPSASLVSWWFLHLYHLARLRLCPQRTLTTTQWKDSAENLSLRTFPGTYTPIPGFLGQQQLNNSLWTLPWFQMFLAKLNSAFRRSAISVTDERVQTMNEFLTCIKLIKMYAWEKSFTNTIRGRMSNCWKNRLTRRVCFSNGFLRFWVWEFWKWTEGTSKLVCRLFKRV